MGRIHPAEAKEAYSASSKKIGERYVRANDGGKQNYCEGDCGTD
jgi:hypothetical protein